MQNHVWSVVKYILDVVRVHEGSQGLVELLVCACRLSPIVFTSRNYWNLEESSTTLSLLLTCYKKLMTGSISCWLRLPISPVISLSTILDSVNLFDSPSPPTFFFYLIDLSRLWQAWNFFLLFALMLDFFV